MAIEKLLAECQYRAYIYEREYNNLRARAWQYANEQNLIGETGKKLHEQIMHRQIMHRFTVTVPPADEEEAPK